MTVEWWGGSVRCWAMEPVLNGLIRGARHHDNDVEGVEQDGVVTPALRVRA